MRANAYFYAMEDMLDTAGIPYVGRIQAHMFDRQFAIRDMFGALSLEAKRLGGNGFRFVRFFYDQDSKGLKLQLDVFKLSDELGRANQAMKPRGRVAIISNYHEGEFTIDDKEYDIDPQCYYSIPVEKGKFVTVRVGGMAKIRFMGALLDQKSQYFIMEPRSNSAAFVGPYFGGLAGGIALAISGKDKLAEIDENLGSILVKTYRKREL